MDSVHMEENQYREPISHFCMLTALSPSSQSKRAGSECNGVANRGMGLSAVNASSAALSQPASASILLSSPDEKRTASSHRRFATSLFMAPRVQRSSEPPDRCSPRG